MRVTETNKIISVLKRIVDEPSPLLLAQILEQHDATSVRAALYEWTNSNEGGAWVVDTLMLAMEERKKDGR